MSYTKILVHAVWGTKNRQPVLINGRRDLLQKHIYENACLKKIHINCIGGYYEHLHLLISISGKQNVAEIIGLIKGESSYWANKTGLFENKFEWADDYFAASINLSSVEKVQRYILNQEEHHKNMTFIEEYGKFVKTHGFQMPQ